MKPLTVSDASLILSLQEEIRRSEDARYDHRLHGVLLVAQGMSARSASKILGDSPRTVQNWVNRFNERGFGGLVEDEKPGRPRLLSDEHLKEINNALRESPRKHGLLTGVWDGRTLSSFIKKKFKISLGIRHCQRIFRDLGFRYRKPRGMVAQGDAELRAKFKKKAS